MASILVVCTGNVCRSPIAEGFLRDAVWRRFGDEAPHLSSAGTAGWEGRPAMPESIQAAAEERGVDISRHVGRRLRLEHVQEADLILCMAGEHREQVDAEAPEAAPRTFTLKELVRLLEELPPVAEDDGAAAELLLGRVRQAGALRRSGFRGNLHDEDVADPLGLPLESYRAVAWELDGWCARLLDGLFGRARARAGSGAEGE